MDIFNVFKQRSQKISEIYNKNYWNEAFSGYTNVGGRINWDATSNKISYNQPTKALPTLNAMWSDYLKGAQSRGIKPDFLTFKKMYDVLKLEKQKNLVNTLTQAKVSGVPISKIHELLRNEPGFRSELVKTISTSQDPAIREALAEYVPPPEQSMQQWADANPGKLGMGITAATIGGAYALSPNDPMTSEQIAQRLEEMGRIPKKPSYYDKNLGKWVGKEPTAYTEVNKKIDAHSKKRPVRSRYKSDATFNKANKAHTTKFNELVSERERILNEANAKYKTDIKTYNEAKTKLNRDIRSGDQTRLGKWLGGKSRMSPLMRGGVGLGMFMGAPMATSAIAKSMGFDEKGQRTVADATTGLVAAGYSLPTIKKAFDIYKGIPAAQRTMTGVSRALAGKGIGASLAAAVLALAATGISMYMNRGASTTTAPSNEKIEPTFKKHDLVL